MTNKPTGETIIGGRTTVSSVCRYTDNRTILAVGVRRPYVAFVGDRTGRVDWPGWLLAGAISGITYVSSYPK